MKEIALKVCGMRDRINIHELSMLAPAYMGFIFYRNSPRYALDLLDPDQLKELDRSIEKVAVFVNAEIEEIEDIIQRFGITTIQLHGKETPQFCKDLKMKGFKIIKAFGLDNCFDFTLLEKYRDFCDYFLFDTKSENYGGTGNSFDWEVLKNYDNALPVFLSGGIDLANLEKINTVQELNIHALDINSKFEIDPAFKNIDKINLFQEQLAAINFKLQS